MDAGLEDAGVGEDWVAERWRDEGVGVRTSGAESAGGGRNPMRTRRAPVTEERERDDRRGYQTAWEGSAMHSEIETVRAHLVQGIVEFDGGSLVRVAPMEQVVHADRDLAHVFLA